MNLTRTWCSSFFAVTLNPRRQIAMADVPFKLRKPQEIELKALVTK